MFFQNPVKKKQYILLLSDLVLICCSFFVAYWIRHGIIENTPWMVLGKLSAMIGMVVFVHLFVLYIFELYELAKPFYFFRTLIKITLAVGLTVGFLSVLSYWFPMHRVGKQVMLIQTPLTIGLLLVCRLLFNRARQSFNHLNRILLIGEDASIDFLTQQLEAYPLEAYQVAGILHGSQDPSEHQIRGVPTFPCSRLKEIVQEKRISTIIFTSPSSLEQEQLKQALQLRSEGVKIYDILTFYKQLTGKIPILQVDELWLLFSSSISSISRSSHYDKLKRLIDLFLATLGLACSLVVVIIFAIAIKLTSKGPVFLKQKRVGINGKEFTLYKFRTMVLNSELKTGAKWKLNATEKSSYALTQASHKDPRVTPIGRILRKSRIDELPQLFNVLKGDLSIVGPRPVRKIFEDQFAQEIPFYSLRHSVKPGITGWAQTRYYNDRTEEGPLERFQYDLFYIQECSLFLDLMILLKTVQTLLCKVSR